MNKLTQKSFWLFLSLYLTSSFILLAISSYWFYSAQTSMQKSHDYFVLRHITDQVNSNVIKSHMMNKPFVLKNYKDVTVGLYDANKTLLYGSSIQNVNFDIPLQKKDSYMLGDVFTVISQGTAGHLKVKYVVAQSTQCASSLRGIKEKIALVVTFVAMFIITVSVILSKIFLRPIKDKMQEIENFVKDTTHELNTPITALMMSTSRAKSKKSYDAKIIQNISISTKQVYEIYASLSYISFESKEENINLKFDDVVQESIKYFTELLDKKNIKLTYIKEECKLHITPTKAKMLINNLLSNAIKYSHPNSNITIKLTQKKFEIQDEGIGIANEKLKIIFKRFSRANSYAGGFGVGLSIVDEISKKYNYTIDIVSKEHIGTKITIQFD